MSGDSKPTTRYQPNDELFADAIDKMEQSASFCSDSARAMRDADDVTGAAIYAKAFNDTLENMHAIRRHEQR